MTIYIKDSLEKKVCLSEDFNMIFDKVDGTTLTWGKTLEEDPEMCQYGAIIADIEVTTICNGINGTPCSFCYKSNTSKGYNMPLETFKRIIDTLPKTITQVALGADAKCESNPDIWDMMNYCREKGIIPNITVANVDEDTANKLARVCGAVSISYYGDWDIFYSTVTNLHKAKKQEGSTLKQINIHQLVAEETVDNINFLITSYFVWKDKINALVLLSLKQRGRGKLFNRIDDAKFFDIIKQLDEKSIPYGFDSCSACKATNTLIQLKNEAPMINIESCESTLYSCYFDAKGNFYPCSFNEEEEYKINIYDVEDFIRDLWFHPKTVKFRNRLLSTKNDLGLCSCPSYEV